MSGGPKPIAILVIFLRRYEHLLNSYGSGYTVIALLCAMSIVVLILKAVGLI
jgi:hypothetical protein